MDITGLHAGLVVVVFLYMLNGYLQGASKALIELFFMVVWIALLVAAFWIFGLTSGLLAIALSGVYAALTKPLAASVSRRILGHRTAFELSESMRARTYTPSLEDILRDGEETEKRILAIAKKTAIARVLSDRGLTSKDLYQVYSFLARAGLGEITWDLISNPKDLTKSLDIMKQGLSDVEVFSRLTAV